MNKRLLIVYSFCISAFTVAGQTHTQEGQLDQFRLSLLGPASSKTENVSMYVDNRSIDGYDGANITAPIDNLNLGSNHMFSGYCTLEGTDIFLIRDTRPYNTARYCVDYPLYVDLNLTGEYTISCIGPNQDINKTAVVVRLIDNLNPDKFINIMDGSYVFNVSESQQGKFYDRFRVRIYAGCLFKKDAKSSDWDDPENWIGGVPGQGTDARKDNCVFIPDGAEVVIPAGKNYAIGALLNSGNVTIEKSATLTVNNEAKLSTLNEIY